MKIYLEIEVEVGQELKARLVPPQQAAYVAPEHLRAIFAQLAAGDNSVPHETLLHGDR
jgi:hypothetical protein